MLKTLSIFVFLGALCFSNNVSAQRKVFTKKNGITIITQEEPRIGECQGVNGKKIYQHRITVYAMNENNFETTFNTMLKARVPNDIKLTGDKGSCWNKMDRGTWRDVKKIASKSEITLITKIVLSDNPNTAGAITCEVPDLLK